MLTWSAFAGATNARAGIVAVAPHPDDETLGCGGLIASATASGIDVTVVHVTDGEASHPASMAWPAHRLGRRRSEEAVRACRILGVASRPVRLGLPDGRSHEVSGHRRVIAIAKLANVVRKRSPGLVVTTWKREPHCDHRAAYRLTVDALRSAKTRSVLAQYTVWTGRFGDDGDRPQPGEATGRTIALGAARVLKRRALTAHRSQLGGLVTDDPDGFALSAADISRMTGPFETYWFDRPGPGQWSR